MIHGRLFDHLVQYMVTEVQLHSYTLLKHLERGLHWYMLRLSLRLHRLFHFHVGYELVSMLLLVLREQRYHMQNYMVLDLPHYNLQQDLQIQFLQGFLQCRI